MLVVYIVRYYRIFERLLFGKETKQLNCLEAFDVVDNAPRVRDLIVIAVCCVGVSEGKNNHKYVGSNIQS